MPRDRNEVSGQPRQAYKRVCFVCAVSELRMCSHPVNNLPHILQLTSRLCSLTADLRMCLHPKLASHNVPRFREQAVCAVAGRIPRSQAANGRANGRAAGDGRGGLPEP